MSIWMIGIKIMLHDGHMEWRRLVKSVCPIIKLYCNLNRYDWNADWFEW